MDWWGQPRDASMGDTSIDESKTKRKNDPVCRNIISPIRFSYCRVHEEGQDLSGAVFFTVVEVERCWDNFARGCPFPT